MKELDEAIERLGVFLGNGIHVVPTIQVEIIPVVESMLKKKDAEIARLRELVKWARDIMNHCLKTIPQWSAVYQMFTNYTVDADAALSQPQHPDDQKGGEEKQE